MEGALELIFGYTISAAIQVLVTREQMARALGERGVRQASLAGFFGSFPPLAPSRLWQRPAPSWSKARINRTVSRF